MELDKRQIINKLNSLSDDELKNFVRSIAECAGVSRRRAEQATSDVDKLRKNFAGMSDKDLQRAMSALDPDTVENIKRQINK